MIVSLIAAISENYVIGKDRGMPWNMPADLKYFYRITKGHHVIMGRKTFNEYGVSKPLPDRTNIIVSRDPEFKAEGTIVAKNIEEALKIAAASGESEVFIIGGGEIYRQSMLIADKLYITLIHTRIEDGDTFFPQIDPHQWELVMDEWHEKDEKNPFDYSFRVYQRRLFEQHA